MSAKKEAYISFILDELKKGNVEYKNVMSLFVNKWQLSERQFVRHWNESNERYKIERDAINKLKEEEYTQMELEAFKSQILQSNEKKEILSAIIRGDKVVDDILIVNNNPKQYKRAANARERIEAIKVLNSMDGDNAPVKTETKLSLGVDAEFEE